MHNLSTKSIKVILRTDINIYKTVYGKTLDQLNNITLIIISMKDINKFPMYENSIEIIVKFSTWK